MITREQRREWCLWEAEQRGPSDLLGAHYWRSQADEPGLDERRIADAARERARAAEYRRVGLLDLAADADARATAAENPTPFVWPDGYDRARAEAVAAAEFPGMPTSGASDEFLSGVIIEVEKRKARAAPRNDAARFDEARWDMRGIHATGLDRVAARAHVAHTDLAGTEREAAIDAIAHRTAWLRARETHVAESTRARLDRAEITPTPTEIRRARRELQHKRPPPSSPQAADAYGAAAHEAEIAERARRIAAVRTADDIERDVRSTLPQAPEEVRLPQPKLPKPRRR